MADDRTTAYAMGIYEIARGEGQADRVEAELFGVAQAFETSNELRTTLSDASIPLERRQSIVGDLLGTRASDLTVSVLGFLVSTGRIGELGEIARAVSDHAATTANKEVAVVRSAIDLDDATVERLAAALQRATGKSVDVKVVVDPSVLGGIEATVGDTVIDGTVRSKLDQLRATVATR